MDEDCGGGYTFTDCGGGGFTSTDYGGGGYVTSTDYTPSYTDHGNSHNHYDHSSHHDHNSHHNTSSHHTGTDTHHHGHHNSHHHRVSIPEILPAPPVSTGDQCHGTYGKNCHLFHHRNSCEDSSPHNISGIFYKKKSGNQPSFVAKKPSSSFARCTKRATCIIIIVVIGLIIALAIVIPIVIINT